MKPNEKYFFHKIDPEFCSTLDAFEIGDEIEGAKIVYGDKVFFCAETGFCGESSSSDCGRLCKHYKPRNGKNGRCRFSKSCYEPNGKFYTVTENGVVEGEHKKS